MTTRPAFEYKPALHGGKYHRPHPITGQSLCRGTILLDTTATPFIHEADTKAHPVLCKTCVAGENRAA